MSAGSYGPIVPNLLYYGFLIVARIWMIQHHFLGTCVSNQWRYCINISCDIATI